MVRNKMLARESRIAEGGRDQELVSTATTTKMAQKNAVTDKENQETQPNNMPLTKDAPIEGGKGMSKDAPTNEHGRPSTLTTAVASKSTKQTIVTATAVALPSSKQSRPKHSKLRRDRKKALRKRYLETGGEGMKPELIEKAKKLMQRDSEKKKKRQAADIVL